MFCQNANQSLGVSVSETRVARETQNDSDYFGQLFKRLTEDGILEESAERPSSKEVGPWLLELLEKFKVGSNSDDKRKQATLIWALREYLGRDVAF